MTSQGSTRPILICYDGSSGAKRAVAAAGVLVPGRPAVVLYVASRVAAERVRTTPVAGVRDELLEEVRVAARREADAIAAEGATRARAAGLDPSPLVVETADGIAETIVRVATERSVAAVVIGQRSRSGRIRRRGGVSRGVLDRCPLPVVVV